MVCFDGPDAGKGFVVNANGDNKAMFMNCELTRALLQRLGPLPPPPMPFPLLLSGLCVWVSSLGNAGFQGMDWSRVQEQFSLEGLKQEEIVNLGISDLVLKAFLPGQPKARL